MSVPPIPHALEPLARRPFAFYPPILNVEHNEWRFRKASWSEILVANERSDMEIWISRRYLGEISSIEEPLMIVGLNRELEYKAGTVWPRGKRVLEMPRTMDDDSVIPEPAPPGSGPAAVLGIRHPPSTESRIGRLIAAAVAFGILVCFIVVAVFRGGALRPVKFTSLDQDFLTLSRHDDYFGVVRKLGPPKEDRWRSDTGDLQYRLLWYPERAYFVILMGTERGGARYIGAMDRNWRPVHYIDLPNGSNTSSMLRTLPKF